MFALYGFPLISSVIATAPGPWTGVAGAASACSGARIPVLSTPVPAPSPCRNPRRENALLRFFRTSSFVELTSDLPFVLTPTISDTTRSLQGGCRRPSNELDKKLSRAAGVVRDGGPI